jgi:hypothetical protein
LLLEIQAVATLTFLPTLQNLESEETRILRLRKFVCSYALTYLDKSLWMEIVPRKTSQTQFLIGFCKPLSQKFYLIIWKYTPVIRGRRNLFYHEEACCSRAYLKLCVHDCFQAAATKHLQPWPL